MKILIIDDDEIFSKEFETDISKFFNKYNIDIRIKSFHSNFLDINFNDRYRLAFVDIDLKETNGIALSKKIKQYSPSCDIIFISAKNNLIHSSLSVQPFFFIRKSNYLDDLYIFFELIKESLSNKSLIQLSYKLNRIIVSINDIIYIESTQHILNIHTCYNVYKDSRTLKDFSTLLPASHFIQIHRAFFINPKYIHSFSRGQVVLCKDINSTNERDYIKLTISRSFQKDFENKYQEYLML